MAKIEFACESVQNGWTNRRNCFSDIGMNLFLIIIVIVEWLEGSVPITRQYERKIKRIKTLSSGHLATTTLPNRALHVTHRTHWRRFNFKWIIQCVHDLCIWWKQNLAHFLQRNDGISAPLTPVSLQRIHIHNSMNERGVERADERWKDQSSNLFYQFFSFFSSIFCDRVSDANTFPHICHSLSLCRLAMFTPGFSFVLLCIYLVPSKYINYHWHIEKW